MKKAILATMLAIAAASPAAETVRTNTVYVVSNIYFYVTSITNYSVYRTNFNYEVVNTNFEPWIQRAADQAALAGSSAQSAQQAANAAHSDRQGAENASQSAAAVLAYIQQYSGTLITNVDIHAVMDPDTHHAHVATNGTTYADLQIYPYGNENGFLQALSPSSSSYNHGATLTFQVLYMFRHNGSASGAWKSVACDFAAGYVDSDPGGMRVHYVPAKEGAVHTVDGMLLVEARDFYWQAGRYYSVFDVSVLSGSATNRLGEVAFQGKALKEQFVSSSSEYLQPFPYSVASQNADGFYTADLKMEAPSSFPYRAATAVYFKTKRNATAPKQTPIWFPRKWGSEGE